MNLSRQPEPELMDLPEEADAYARAGFEEVNEAFVQRLLELCGERAFARVVDLGTGPAHIPIRLIRARPGWQVTAVDGAAAMLELAWRAVSNSDLLHVIRLVQSDAKHTALSDASFDVVMSNSLLHHITDTAALWNEVRRIARPGGRVFMRDLARPPSELVARQIVREHAGEESELLQEEFYRSLLAAYNLEEIRQQLRLAGLDHFHVQMVSDRHVDVHGPIQPG